VISREDTISVSSKLQYSERCSVACSRGRRLQTPELWFGLCNQLPKRGARGRVYGVPPTKPDNGVRLFRARPTRRQRPVTPQQPAHAGMVRQTVTGGTPDEAQPAQQHKTSLRSLAHPRNASKLSILVCLTKKNQMDGPNSVAIWHMQTSPKCSFVHRIAILSTVHVLYSKPIHHRF
jgi:hypothetical protein